MDVHDFPDPALGKAVPYGVFDLAADAGFVTVGSDGDTAEFAVASIGRWWERVGSAAYPDATRLLIAADAGGSNSCRSRLWKRELGALADRTGLAATVRHGRRLRPAVVSDEWPSDNGPVTPRSYGDDQSGDPIPDQP